MEGAHDLGGVGGFGAVRTPDGELTRHEAWELRAQNLASSTCRGSRPWIERLDPSTYLNTPYYARCLLACEMYVAANGVLDPGVLADWRERIERGETPPRVERPDLVAQQERRMLVPEPMTPTVDHRFACGDQVVPRRIYDPVNHHRIPRYVRGVPGVVETVCGEERLAGWRGYDIIEPIYTVRFESTDVWGERSDEPAFAVFVDLWESYLEPVGQSERT
jgi:nitrile hydratase subunit beta